MATARIEFDLNDPDDVRAFDDYNKLNALLSLVEDFGRYLRDKNKYGKPEIAIQEVWDTWNELKVEGHLEDL